jgi:hypothetical protein
MSWEDGETGYKEAGLLKRFWAWATKPRAKYKCGECRGNPQLAANCAACKGTGVA